MGLRKTQDPRIDPRRPWGNDDLHREREGVLLTRLIQSLTGSYVVAVKGSWGTGKSVFLRRLSAHLERESIPVITIDAWRTDYLEDPLIAFVSATEQRIADQRTQSEARAAKGKTIVKGLAKFAGRLAPSLSGVVAEVLAPGAGIAVEAVAETAEHGGQALLEAIKTRKDAEEQFRDQLSSARDFLTRRPKNRPVRPIVVAIDELDRCRPNYAVKVLERIKHYFDVKGVVFVIATDGANLPNAVASVYGHKIDGELYLRKFFDYEFELPEPDPQHFVEVLADQFEFNALVGDSAYERAQLAHMIEHPTDGPHFNAVEARDRGLDAMEILQAFPFMAKSLGLSLRDQAQAFTLINAYLRTLGPRVVIYPAMLAFIYSLRFSDPALYQLLRRGKADLGGLFSRGRVNTPPLVHEGDVWTLQNTFGRELQLFCTAVEDDQPRRYIEDVRRGAHQANPQNHQFSSAADRMYGRTIADPEQIKQFLSRAFSLADAFA